MYRLRWTDSQLYGTARLSFVVMYSINNAHKAEFVCYDKDFVVMWFV